MYEPEDLLVGGIKELMELRMECLGIASSITTHPSADQVVIDAKKFEEFMLNEKEEQ